MLKAKKIKEAKAEAKKEAEANGETVSILNPFAAKKAAANNSKEKKRTPGEIRIQKDITELDGGNVAVAHFENPDDLTRFTVTVKPDSGLWKGAAYDFKFEIPPDYPHKPPKVTLSKDCKIYHPNINLEGNVCLNILREDWKPVLDINAVIYGVIYLFYEPNPNDPLNHEAAELFRSDFDSYKRVVKSTLRGGYYQGVTYPRMIDRY